MKEVEKPIPDKNEKNIYIITNKYCCDLSEYNGHSSIPKFISTLHLHFKGFSKIEALENFVNLRILYLENNCFSKVENLKHLTNLQCLYLNNNFLEDISELNHNTTLKILNLSHNKLKKLPFLNLPELQTLTLDNNFLENLDDISTISFTNFPALSVLGIAENFFDSEGGEPEFPLISFLSEIKTLRVLYFKGNPLIRKIPNYRKRMIRDLENLTYLDDKPIHEIERLSVDAFWKGGLSLERKVKEEYRQKMDFGFRVREIDSKNKVDISLRKKAAEESLKNEYIYKKNELKKKKQTLLKEYESVDELMKKSNIFMHLLSIDNQINENEKFKVEEESDSMSIVVKRGDHITKITNNEVEEEISDASNIFIFENWMNVEFEFYLIRYLWSFKDAVDSFKFKFKGKVKNIENLTERDLRLRWSSIEMERLNKINLGVTNYEFEKIKQEKNKEIDRINDTGINFEELD